MVKTATGVLLYVYCTVLWEPQGLPRNQIYRQNSKKVRLQNTRIILNLYKKLSP